LRDAGVSEAQIAAGANGLDDNTLGYHAANAMQLHDRLKLELDQREFEAGKVMAPTPGAGLFRVRPNSVETIVAPNDGSKVTGSPVTNNPNQKSIGGKTYEKRGEDWYEIGGPTPQASGGF